MCSYGDDFFLVLRPEGNDVRLLVSDVTAVGEWPIAREALDLVGEAEPEEDDFEHVAPAGDLDIFADFGMGSMELSRCARTSSSIPTRCSARSRRGIGFGPQFDRLVDDDLYLTDHGGDPVSYFTAVLAREGRRWTAHDVDVESLEGPRRAHRRAARGRRRRRPGAALPRARGRLVGGRAGRRRRGPAGVRVRRGRRRVVVLLRAAGRSTATRRTSPSRAPAPETSTCWSTSARRPRR